jgi:hypothetical protein
VRIFGTPQAAFDAMNGSNFDTGQAGTAADAMDLNHFGKYAAAGVSDFYIRNFPQFNKVLYGSNTAKSWYDSFQFGLRKSAAAYQMRLYYTWSKSMDTLSSGGGSYVIPPDSFNPDSNKALSDFDREHVLNIAVDYALPFGASQEGDSESTPWLHRILGGWNLGALYIWESGPHFSVYSGRETQYAGVQSLASYGDTRPTGGLNKYQGIVYWFAPDQADLFTYPASGEAGSSGRNYYVGQSYSNIDAVLRKTFKWNERKSVQLRLEGYNLFNTAHFGLPITTMGSNGFGTIRTTQGAPRSFQMALQLGF